MLNLKVLEGYMELHIDGKWTVSLSVQKQTRLNTEQPSSADEASIFSVDMSTKEKNIFLVDNELMAVSVHSQSGLRYNYELHDIVDVTSTAEERMAELELAINFDRRSIEVLRKSESVYKSVSSYTLAPYSCPDISTQLQSDMRDCNLALNVGNNHEGGVPLRKDDIVLVDDRAYKYTVLDWVRVQLTKTEEGYVVV